MTPADWIPVSFALPDTGTVAVGLDRNGDYCLLVNIAGNLYDYRSGHRRFGIVHWTPVPAPPPPKSDQ